VAIAFYPVYRWRRRGPGLSACAACGTAGLGALLALLGPWAAAWWGSGAALALVGLAVAGGGLAVAWSEGRYRSAGGEEPEGEEAAGAAGGDAARAAIVPAPCAAAGPWTGGVGEGIPAAPPDPAPEGVRRGPEGDDARAPGPEGAGGPPEGGEAAAGTVAPWGGPGEAPGAEGGIPVAPVADAGPEVPEGAGGGENAAGPCAGEEAPTPVPAGEGESAPVEAEGGTVALLEEGYRALAAGRIEEARGGFRRALEGGLPPSLAVLVAGNAAALHRGSGEYREAVRLLRRVRLLYGARLSAAELAHLEAQITYLEAVRWLLEREGLAGLPWHAVPAALKERAARAARYTS
ncbi:MAG: hypothetical protein H5T97_07180, partial [Firmicutes bacterium]|nr:hypothetical protein [Bacillota bacterium]